MVWRAVKAQKLLKIGWQIKRKRGSHYVLMKSGYPDYTFASHNREEVGPRMLARIAKCTGLRPKDI